MSEETPKRKYQRISGYKVVEIVHLHLSGLTLPEIATQIGCHRESIGRILKSQEAEDAKFHLSRGYAKGLIKEKLHPMYVTNGKSIDEATKEFSVKYHWVPYTYGEPKNVVPMQYDDPLDQ